MIIHHKFESLGSADHGWLKAKHHFSFAKYHDINKMSFGELLVINDDRIAPNSGFGMHPHNDMEIITFVKTGAISHEDNQGNKGKTLAGNIQVMSAGTGIIHSEYNHEEKETTLYQIWISPKTKGIKPRWDSGEFPKKFSTDKLKLLVSGFNDAPLKINQDARIYTGKFDKKNLINHHINGQAYLLISKGSVNINSINGLSGDGIAIKDEERICIEASQDTELLLIEIPGLIEAR